MALLDGRNVQNAAAHVPYANVRTLACGFRRDPPDDYQNTLIRASIEQAMSEGAVGLSTGLDYIVQNFSTTDELVAAAAATAPFDGLYVTHMRYKRGIVRGLQEAVEIGRRAGVRVHISHLKGLTPQERDAVREYLDGPDVRDTDLSFDVYPYLPGSTMLHYLLPYEVWEDGPLAVLGKLKDRRIRDLMARSLAASQFEQAHIAWVAGKDNSVHQGKLVGQYVREMGRPAAVVLCDLLIEERLAVLFVERSDEADPVLIEPLLAHPRFMLGSDGIYQPDAMVHPRVYGSAPRILGHYVRERQLFSLEDAVYKLSAFAAERFRLSHRGVLRSGHFADIVVFDPDTIADRATFDDPQQYSIGVEHVLVNGVPILRDGQPIADLPEPLPGRFLPSGSK
jgi:N-acyl-D-amino-acid deacylase